MDAKHDFYARIYSYYYKIVGESIPLQLLDELYEKITDYIYEQYVRCSKKYPKSIKRYSSLKVDDLDHPQIFELIIKFFKQKSGSKYLEYSGNMLNISQEEINDFEKRREEFYDMF